MPQLKYTAAKGLIQQNGTGFPAMDFLMRNEVNLSTTGAASISQASAADDADGSSDAATILACTLVAMKANECAFTGAAAGNLYLPAAEEGVHLSVKMTAAVADVNDLTIKAQGSAVEAARVAAGGTAATFMRTNARVDNYKVGQNSQSPVVIAGTHKTLVLNYHGTNCSFEQNTVIHFYCPSPGKWLFAFDNISAGNGSEFTTS